MPLAFAMHGSPLTGDGLSSLDLRFSPRGGKKDVGEVEGGVFDDGLLEDDDEDDDDDEEDVEFPVVRPPRPLAPPLRSLECTY